MTKVRNSGALESYSNRSGVAILKPIYENQRPFDIEAILRDPHFSYTGSDHESPTRKPTGISRTELKGRRQHLYAVP
jgi:hypothetical protein